jgi:hypothetical protein|tara:strand:+ start:1310 stop:1432 length:123 start_codon:yes stop_codon:yes gene_type:complete
MMSDYDFDESISLWYCLECSMQYYYEDDIQEHNCNGVDDK